MLREVQSHSQEEACGLLAGSSVENLVVYPVTNALHSPVRFYMQPEELISVFGEIDDQGWEVVAIYHSHLKGPPVPSPTDVDEFRYPGTLALIWSPGAEGWICRAFLIEQGSFFEVPIQVEDLS